MKKVIIFEVNEDQYQKLKDFAAEHQKPMSAVLREMIAFFIPDFGVKQIQPPTDPTKKFQAQQ